MSDNNYTSTTAQTVEAAGNILKETPTSIIYFVITVGSLLGVLYFLADRVQIGLSDVSAQLSVIDKDLKALNYELERQSGYVISHKVGN